MPVFQESPHVHHPLGDCVECDLRLVAVMSVTEVEEHYVNGMVCQDLFDAYMHTWVTMAPRSGLYDYWKNDPEEGWVSFLVKALRPLMTRTA